MGNELGDGWPGWEAHAAELAVQLSAAKAGNTAFAEANATLTGRLQSAVALVDVLHADIANLQAENERLKTSKAAARACDLHEESQIKIDKLKAENERLTKLKDRQTQAVIDQDQGVRRLIAKLDRLEVIEQAARAFVEDTDNEPELDEAQNNEPTGFFIIDGTHIAALRDALSGKPYECAECDRLRGLLKEYGGHKHDCYSIERQQRFMCNCGWPAIAENLARSQP